MNDHPTRLFDSGELASHIADTLVSHQLVTEDARERAVASIKWELDAQAGMQRVVLRAG